MGQQTGRDEAAGLFLLEEGIPMDRTSISGDCREEPGIIYLLERLIEELAKECAGRPQTVPRGGLLERWEDEGFVYLEAGLSAEAAPFVDICLSGGKAYIRVERSAVPPTLRGPEQGQVQCQ